MRSSGGKRLGADSFHIDAAFWLLVKDGRLSYHSELRIIANVCVAKSTFEEVQCHIKHR
jgi:hypothetical protein